MLTLNCRFYFLSLFFGRLFPFFLYTVSLKCGGVGLTLTRANRVISLG
jgi:hypothetical protein